MIERTLCNGRTVEGRPCRQVRLGVEPPWFCKAHRAQDGKKRIVSAVVPAWVHGTQRVNDDVYPEWTI